MKSLKHGTRGQVNTMISRQKLIEELETEILENPIYNPEEECIEYGISPARMFEIIKSQPPADQWIPCSEGLPDDDGFYLATVLNGLGYTTTQKLLFNGKGWCTDMPWEILAWMPVPEPYKGVE